MYRLINHAHIPKWLKLILYFVITFTLIYLPCLIVYKTLEALRKFTHWASDKRNYWTFLMCILILAVGTLVVAQCMLGLDPFGKFINWLVNIFNNIRENIAGFIGGA